MMVCGNNKAGATCRSEGQQNSGGESDRRKTQIVWASALLQDTDKEEMDTCW